jgi:hypothetical protein
MSLDKDKIKELDQRISNMMTLVIQLEVATHNLGSDLNAIYKLIGKLKNERI